MDSLQLTNMQISLPLQFLRLQLEIGVLLLQCVLTQLEDLITFVVLLHRVASSHRIRFEERCIVAVLELLLLLLLLLRLLRQLLLLLLLLLRGLL